MSRCGSLPPAAQNRKHVRQIEGLRCHPLRPLRSHFLLHYLHRLLLSLLFKLMGIKLRLIGENLNLVK
jgi:hypothetical protein